MLFKLNSGPCQYFLEIFVVHGLATINKLQFLNQLFFPLFCNYLIFYKTTAVQLSKIRLTKIYYSEIY